MSEVDLVLLAVLLFAGWYLGASLAARWINRRAVSRCGCEAARWLGGASSLYVDLRCGGRRVEVFINRLPWDNPLNLAASLVARRRGYTAVRLKADADLGVFDASRVGSGRRIGAFYVVNTSGPRWAVEAAAKAGEEAGAWRVTASGGVLQLLFPHTDCGRAVQSALTFLEKLPRGPPAGG
ncbi:hypothetical protein [Pyrobaculum neutrophilum]|uniref:Uncharacterized protein n=1 Tax=Pyrobaculum neutrophilum (strain DSM 2338 / JCM 9278 / NBRC 100436 / V24Sta) TaxID=444157 RepID=B1YC81_PYRNV|nr:hypothetical protein [Pyrobaculum neutrophilum]ACB39394.1 conserved hypothetical protein [Pyrobaculum neutrophilum V24Sta]